MRHCMRAMEDFVSHMCYYPKQYYLLLDKQHRASRTKQTMMPEALCSSSKYLATTNNHIGYPNHIWEFSSDFSSASLSPGRLLRDNEIMDPIQRCNSGELACRFHGIWRPRRAISDCEERLNLDRRSMN